MGKYIRISDVAKHSPQILESLIDQDSMIVCRNKISGNMRTERFNRLYRNNDHFWSVGEEWDYFIRKDYLSTLLTTNVNVMQKSMKRKVTEIMGRQFEEVSNLSPEDRTRRLEYSIEKVEQVLHRKKVSSKEISETLVESSIYSALVNKVTLEETYNQDDLEARHNSIKMAKKTEALMDSLIEVISRDFEFDDTLLALEKVTSGNTLKHMTRVFIHTMRFMDYIQSQIEYSGLNTWILGRYESYRPLYESLFDSLQGKEMNIHKIIMEPIKITEELYRNISLGMMLHDIGKKKNLSYFEGGESYQRDVIEAHAFDGYFMIMRRSVYKEEVAAMAGMHHEYYGSPNGYGIYRENLEEHGLTMNSPSVFKGIMTNDFNNIKSFKAMAYMPAKILEIIDVYDALIDPAREYKPPMSTLAALKMMKQEMVIDHLKLDPILFDLFVKYLRSSSALT